MKNIFNKTDLVSNYKPIYESDGKWYVCFNYAEEMRTAAPVLLNGRYVKSNSVESTGMCSFNYMVYDSKPTPELVKADIKEYVDMKVQHKIMNGFVWKDCRIKLTKENQMNYKSMYDIVQTNNTMFPIRIKATKNGKTEYIIFYSANEYSDFYINSVKHINKCLEEGWKEKDSFDYSLYK